MVLIRRPRKENWRKLTVITVAFLIVLSQVFYFQIVPYKSPLEDRISKGILLLLVQGTAVNFVKWYERMNMVSTSYSGEGIFLVYASYDMPVNTSSYSSSVGEHNSMTFFIPNTSWTEGRNALAHAAHCLEMQRSQLFSYWIFSDDDIELVCPNDSNISEAQCWGNFFDFIENQGPLSHAATIAVVHESQVTLCNEPNGVLLTNSYDAILNAYKREFVPFLLPYVTKMPPTMSWWLSQAAHFALMRSCFPMAGLVSLQFGYRNPEHRPYPRDGLGIENAARLVTDNYEQYLGNNLKKPTEASDLNQFAETCCFHSAENSSIHVDEWRGKMNNTCDPLYQRFHDWLDNRTCV